MHNAMQAQPAQVEDSKYTQKYQSHITVKKEDKAEYALPSQAVREMDVASQLEKWANVEVL